MKLHFVSRTRFSKRDSDEFLQELRDQHGRFYFIREGGANEAGARGVEELAGELKEFSHLAVPVGTGTTLAGLINGKHDNQYAMGFATLKGEGYLEESTKRLVNPTKNHGWSINHNFHYGGYARHTPELITFINEFRKRNGIQLDPIYTGKMMLGIYKIVEGGYFPEGCKIAAIHTGGIQGIAGFNQRFGDLIELD